MTADTKHTAGPWIADYEGRVLTCTGRVRKVADVHASDEPEVENGADNADNYWEKVNANCHLIAAAPLMLKALESVVAWFGEGISGEPYGTLKGP